MFLSDVLGTVLEVKEEEEAAERHARHINLAGFAETCIVKMLPFVDALVAQDSSNRASAPADKLQALILVHEAVSRISMEIRFSLLETRFSLFSPLTDEEAKSFTVETLLLAKEAKLYEAIWRAVEETTALLRASAEDDDSSWWISPDIHKVTKAIMSYIRILSTNSVTMHRIAGQAVKLRGYVPKIDDVSPLTSLIMETVSCLEEKLAEKSRSFLDQSFRFLFLINNSHFILEQFNRTSWIPESYRSVLARKMDNYIETYLQVSWAPVLSCLCNSTTLCLGRYPSPAKFEAEFQKTYAAQKLWKVPDPELRRTLRAAVIDKVIPSFTNYLEDNHISPSGITPEDLKDMLQELFEG